MDNPQDGSGNPSNAEPQGGSQESTALTALEEKVADLEAKNRQLYERAKKAEGFDKQPDGSWVKVVEKPKPGRPKKEADEDPASDTEQTALDYSQKAYLLAKGITEAEFDLVLEEAKKFGGNLKDVRLEALVSNPYFQQRLESHRTTQANEAAAQADSKRGTTASGRNTPEYWLAKLGPNESIPADLPRELREKIVDARMNKGANQKVFYSD